MEWINAKDQVPIKGENFLGTDGHIIFAAYWVDEDWYKVGGWECCNYCGGENRVSFIEESHTVKKITHWMQLPKLPQGKEEYKTTQTLKDWDSRCIFSTQFLNSIQM